MHRGLSCDLGQDQINGPKHVVGPIGMAVGRVGLEPEIERVLLAPHTVRIVIVDTVRVDIVESRAAITGCGKVMRVVVGRAAGHIAVAIVHHLTAVGQRFDLADVPFPLRIGPQQIDQDAVELIAPLQRDQGFGKTLAGEPEPGRGDRRIEQVVANRKLAHDRHSVNRLVSHGGSDSITRIHGMAFPSERTVPRELGFGFGRWRGRRPQRRCSLRGEAVAVHQRRRYVDRTRKLIYS